MRYVAVALIVVGIAAMILAAVLAQIGLPGLVGGVSSLLSGIGFLLITRNCPRS